MKVLEVEDHEKLAWEVWASFQLTKRASELHWVENYHQTPPAPLCLLQKNFLLLSNSIFACWDSQKIQCEKMVAYAWALQFWVEKVDPPAGGRPHLWAESVKELWEEMRCYLSFSDEEVIKGVALLEETSAKPTKEANPQSVRTTPVSTTEEEATAGMAKESIVEKRLPIKFLGWEKVLYPSQPMVAARQIPLLSRSPRLREERLVPISWTERPKVTTTPQGTPCPPQELEVAWQATVPMVFWEWWHVWGGISHWKGPMRYPQTCWW